MKNDTITNLAIIIVMILVLSLLTLITRHNASEKLETIMKIRNELWLISEKIGDYHAGYRSYPTSLTDKKFHMFVRGISLRDPFDPENRNYRYKTGNGSWKIYSIGPNRTDDGGITKDETKSVLLDIVVEGKSM